MAITVYPLNDIDFTAEDVAIYNSTRTSGVYAGDDFAISMTGSDNTISVDVGLAWMRLGKFHGVAVALKSKTSIDMGIPDATYPRIDALVLQFNANKNSAEIVSKTGTASSNPQPPVLSQTEALYELHLLHVLRQPGATSITAADVTDLRLDETYCGLMADAVTRVDTAAINSQISALIQKLRDDLAAVEDNNYYASKGYVQTKRISVILVAAGWSSSAPYAQNVTVEGLTDELYVKAFPAWPSDLDEKLALSEETAKIRSCVRSGNTMTFECWKEVPTLDIPIVVEVYV